MATPYAARLVSPIGNAERDPQQSIRLDWDYLEPTSALDPRPPSQGAYQVRRRAVGATGWTSTLQITSVSTFHDLAPGTLALDTDWEWQVRTWSASGEIGPYSDSGFFSTSRPPDAPPVTSPAYGQTVTTDFVQVVWSQPYQDAFEIEVLDEAGALVWSTGVVDGEEGAFARSKPVRMLANNVKRRIRMRTRYNGLWSSWTSDVVVSVSWTPPPGTGADILSDTESGSITVVPLPAERLPGQPHPVGIRVRVRPVGDTGEGRVLFHHTQGSRTDTAPVGVSVVHHHATPGVDYEYRLDVVGSNDAVLDGEWQGGSFPAPVPALQPPTAPLWLEGYPKGTSDTQIVGRFEPGLGADSHALRVDGVLRPEAAMTTGEFILDGLDPLSTVTLEVLAENEHGTTPSEPREASTLAAPPPPSSGGATTPAPTGWESFTPLDVSAGGAFVLLNDTDYLVQGQTAAAPVRLRGGRRVVVMGLTVNVEEAAWTTLSESSSCALSLEENPFDSADSRSGGAPLADRKFHIEGLLAQGSKLTQGIRYNAPTADIALVNCHVKTTRFKNCDHRDGTNGLTINHPDLTQCYAVSQAGCKSLTFDGFTGYSAYQGLFFKDSTTDYPITMRRVDVHAAEVTGDEQDGATGITYAGHRMLWNYQEHPITIEGDTVWVDGHPNNGWKGGTFKKDRYWDGGAYVLDPPLGTATDIDAVAYGAASAATPGSDANGDYATTPNVTGRIRLGSPVSEYVPETSVGAGYGSGEYDVVQTSAAASTTTAQPITPQLQRAPKAGHLLLCPIGGDKDLGDITLTSGWAIPTGGQYRGPSVTGALAVRVAGAPAGDNSAAAIAAADLGPTVDWPNTQDAIAYVLETNLTGASVARVLTYPNPAATSLDDPATSSIDSTLDGPAAGNATVAGAAFALCGVDTALADGTQGGAWSSTADDPQLTNGYLRDVKGFAGADAGGACIAVASRPIAAGDPLDTVVSWTGSDQGWLMLVEVEGIPEGTTGAPQVPDAPEVSVAAFTHNTADLDWDITSLNGGTFQGCTFYAQSDTDPNPAFQTGWSGFYANPADPFRFINFAGGHTYTLGCQTHNEHGPSTMATAQVTTAAAPDTSPTVLFEDEFDGAAGLHFDRSTNGSADWFSETASNNGLVRNGNGSASTQGGVSSPWNRRFWLNGGGYSPRMDQVMPGPGPLGGPGQDLRILITARVDAVVEGSSQIIEGLKFMAKVPAASNPDQTAFGCRGVDDPVGPGSLYAFLHTINGYIEMSRNNPGDVGGGGYISGGKTTLAATVGTAYDYEVRIRWPGGTSLAMDLYRNGVKVGPGWQTSDAAAFQKGLYFGLRSDYCLFTALRYRVETLSGA